MSELSVRLNARRRSVSLDILILLFGLGVNGCGPKVPPPVTTVEGVLLLNDQPVPFAQIDFVPELDAFGAELNSSAVTDANGTFKLTLADGRSGAVVATHRVVVMEGPPPKELRGMDAQERLGEYMRQLKNRPLPEMYDSYGKTPLRVEVKPEQKVYVIKMRR